MADLTITAANVVKGANAKTRPIAYANAVITAGQSLYLAADGRVGLYDANVAAPVNSLYGVSLNGGAANQPILAQYEGDIIIGATVTPGIVYLGSATAGGIRPDADSGSGDTISILGSGKSATTITLAIVNTLNVK